MKKRPFSSPDRLLSILVLVTFTSNIAFAAVNAEQDQFTSGSQWVSDVEIYTASSSLETALDQEIAGTRLESDEIEFSKNLSPRGERRMKRIQNSLNRKLPKIYARIEKTFKQVSDSELEAKLDSLIMEAKSRNDLDMMKSFTAISTKNKSDIRKAVVDFYKVEAKNSIPAISREIAEAGGRLPYLLKLKKDLNKAKNELAASFKDKKKANRSIASSRDQIRRIVGITLAASCILGFGLTMLGINVAAIIMLPVALAAMTTWIIMTERNDREEG